MSNTRRGRWIALTILCTFLLATFSYAQESVPVGKEQRIEVLEYSGNVMVEYYDGEEVLQTDSEEGLLIQVPQDTVLQDVQIRVPEGAVCVKGVLAEHYALETVEGDIDIYLPADTAFLLKLTSISDLFESDLPYDVTDQRNEYICGEDGALIEAETVMGTVRVLELDETSGKPEDTVTVVCVGDSITAAGYPEVLGYLLGDRYEVLNYGQPGSQMLSGERFSYTGLDLYQESLDQQADYYILMLGSNDTMDKDKWDAQRFTQEYGDFLESYLSLGEDVQVYTMIPPCVFRTDNERALSSRINLDILDEEVCPIIAQVSEEAGIEPVDLHTLTEGHPEWLADGLHPNADGNLAIAEYIAETVFGK